MPKLETPIVYYAKERHIVTIPGAERYADKPYPKLTIDEKIQRFAQERVGQFPGFNVSLSKFAYDSHHVMAVPDWEHWQRFGGDHLGAMNPDHAHQVVKSMGKGLQAMVDTGRIQHAMMIANDGSNASERNIVHFHGVGLAGGWRPVPLQELSKLDPDPTGLFSANYVGREVVERVADRLIADSVTEGLFAPHEFTSGLNGSIFMPMQGRLGNMVDNPRVSETLQFANELLRTEMSNNYKIDPEYQCMSFTLDQRAGNVPSRLTLHAAVRFGDKSISGGLEANWYKLTHATLFSEAENIQYLENSIWMGQQIPEFEDNHEMVERIEQLRVRIPESVA